MDRDKINGYGAILRFITPVLVTIALFILGLIRQDIGMLRQDLTLLKTHFENHLSYHREMEVLLEKRLSRIETLLTK